jgi:hypothetical protein
LFGADSGPNGEPWSRSLGDGDSWPVVFGISKKFPDHCQHVAFTEQDKADGQVERASF